MMTVAECITHVRNTTTKRLSRLWVCPEIVNDGRIGNNYVYRSGIENKVNEKLGKCKVKKHWIENGCLCIVYVPEGEPFVFAASP